MIEQEQIRQIVKNALAEDVTEVGDITSLLTIPESARSAADFLVKTGGVIAGLAVARITFEEVDPEIKFKTLIADGSRVAKGDIPARVIGSTRSILKGERVALNFLQRMSGIATVTRQYVKEVESLGTTILDTRKTVPGLRLLDKMAVRLGGGTNHRFSLSDAILIKDNHIEAVGGMSETLEHVFKNNTLNLPVEIEVKNLGELSQALRFPVARILLDNMSMGVMREAVKMTAGKVPLEASGNVNLTTVKRIAETGVTHVSIGALTHSVKALDISLELKKL